MEDTHISAKELQGMVKDLEEKTLPKISTEALVTELLSREGISARRVDLEDKYSIRVSRKTGHGEREVIKTKSIGPCIIIEVVD